MPKVSVIVPVYGVEKYLEECLNSILGQKFEDLEIILIDDGGKDNCPAIIDRYAQKDNRIIAIHKPNGGYGHSCNVGLDRAGGEYISIIEPDDYIDEDMYSDLYPIAIEKNLDIIKTPFIQNYQGGGRHSEMVMPNHKEFIKPKGICTLEENPSFMHMHPSIWSALYKKEFLDKNNIRFVEAPGAGWTDNPFQVQTMCLAERIYWHDKAYYHWRLLNWDELKDYKIPFARTKEIHQWLNENGITDDGILSYLCMREISYFQMINRIIDVSDINDYHRLFNEYYESVESAVLKSKILKPKQKRYLKRMKKYLPLIVRMTKIKMFRQKIFSIQLNMRHQYMRIFGDYVLGDKYD